MFYDNFLKLCNQRGISPTAAVVEMGFQKSVVTRWKKSIPTDANKLKIAQYFGITVDELMHEQKEKPAERASISRKDIKFALFGDPDIDDDLMDDVLGFAEYVRKKREQEKGK